MQQSYFVGMYVVAKLFHSTAPNNKPHLISRTLKKLSIVDKKHSEGIQDKEVWVCKIMAETSPGKSRGVFILKPIERVHNPTKNLRKLIPGYFAVETQGGSAIITPKLNPEQKWILSSVTRQLFQQYSAVVVPIIYQESGEENESENPQNG